ncbi:cytochrome P450 [Schizophyllum commune Loenen D]|nr:cytochrome P450 [Schizophyllum commune Loenen D]
MSFHFDSLHALVLCALLLTGSIYILYPRRRVGLPPGPPSRWLLGTKMPTGVLSWVAFAAWTEQYGSLFTLGLGMGERLIVVGTYKAAIELLERHAPSFADRPRAIAAGEVLSGGMRTLLIPKGERIKKLRRALLMSLQPSASAIHKPVQLKATRIALLDVLNNSDAFVDHYRKYAASLIMHITYGKCSPTTPSDPDVLAVNACLGRVSRAMMPGAYAVDALTGLPDWGVQVLRGEVAGLGWFMRAGTNLLLRLGYMEELRKGHEFELGLFRGKLREVQKAMEAGRARICFATQVLQAQETLGLSFDECAYLCGSQFGAGSDTSASYIIIAIMAAALYPETLKRAQAELDTVVGRGRAPSFEDQPNLPYVAAFMQEVGRWRPVTAGGVQHRATEDVVYDGYVIPKGSRVLGNHWSIHHDPEVFPDPECFRPERWLTDDGKLRTDIRIFTFGFGRRSCPGNHVAERSVFINLAHIFWALDIAEDPAAPIDSMAFEHIANTRPKPFQPIIRPRAGLSAASIRDVLLREDPTLEEGWLAV